MDGANVTKIGTHEITPFLLANLNLPPEIRYLLDNIMCVFLIPGPRKYGLLDSFFYPFVQECKMLAAGVPDVYNAYTNSYFTLFFWPILFSGDGPARADAMGMVRPGNAKTPCGQCLISATQADNKTHYIPHTSSHIRGDLPRRTNLRQDIKQWHLIQGYGAGVRRKELSTQLGITRRSALLELESLHWPRSFPLDLMHCILLNIVPDLYDLWGGKRFTEDAGNASARTNAEPATQPTPDDSAPPPPPLEPYVISDTKIWQYISDCQENSRARIPRVMGQGARRLDRYNGGYKAKEWEAFLVRDSTILLRHLTDWRPYLENLHLLSNIYQVARQQVITLEELTQLRKNCAIWVKNYQDLYYRDEVTRLKVCKINIHSILHLGMYLTRTFTILIRRSRSYPRSWTSHILVGVPYGALYR